MDDTHARDTGRLAVASGAIAAGGAVCLAAYFAIGGPFGTVNDVANGTAGVLSAVLAWRLRHAIAGRARDLALGAAIGGAALTAIGSGLVVSGTTGFFLAGLVSSLGFAGIGTWLVALNRSADAPTRWPRRLRMLGVAAGGLMGLGVLQSPGIVLRLDDMATAPGWIWIGSLGWLGTFVAYPAWAIWMGAAQPGPQSELAAA